MIWLPPNYRILYTDTLNYSKENLEFILLKLIGGLEQGSLIVKYNTDYIGQVVDVTLKDNKFCFYVVERKKDYFKKNNIHLESFKINISIEGKQYGSDLRIESVLNILELERVNVINTENQTETYNEV